MNNLNFLYTYGKQYVEFSLEESVLDECYEELKKDLEVLEILKKHIKINMYGTDAGDKKAIDLLIFEDDEDFKKIKDYVYKY